MVAVKTQQADALLNLDLCILAYQLHAQTLIWPMDPYAEQTKVDQSNRSSSATRDLFFEEAREYLKVLATDSKVLPAGVPAIFAKRGSKSWNQNDKLDPLAFDYARIDPGRAAFARQNRQREPLVIYDVSKDITDRIQTVNVVHYDRSNGPDNPGKLPTKIVTWNQAGFAPKSSATDLLYCFEGATGINRRLAGCWSLMGFVLAREIDSTGGYDIHVVFRGSRSGQTRFRSHFDARGNPDWVTDVGSGRQGPQLKGLKLFTDIAVDKMHKGFARSASSMLPLILECLKHIYQKKGDAAPRKIFASGHSLGGALAMSLGSAVTIGTTYYDTAGSYRVALDAALQSWPWDNMRIFAFSAPPIGGDDCAGTYALNGPSTSILGLKSDPVMGILASGAGLRYSAYPVKIACEATGGDAHQPYWVRLAFRRQYGASTTDVPWRLCEQHGVHRGIQPAAGSVSLYDPAVFMNLPWVHASTDLLHYLAVIKRCMTHDRYPREYGDLAEQKTALEDAYQFLSLPSLMTQFGDEAQVRHISKNCFEKVGMLSASDSAVQMTRAWLTLVMREANGGSVSVSKDHLKWVSLELD